ncbi:MAG TPA: hypothetical protein VNT75_33155 [Symbiobacteriaceae bacterium]|nr:hypothetical protein [Symbiobacteriaceae bacterium]
MRRHRWPIVLLVVLLILAAVGWVGKGLAFNRLRAGLQLDWKTEKVTALSSLPQSAGGHGYGQGTVLKHRDLQSLQITDWQTLLNGNVTWDTATLWPASLPAGFQPDRILELGKDPGLGIRQLHQQGINGKGVRVAFLDRPMSLGHKELGSNVSYFQVGYPALPEMHGVACASLLVGRNVGVAPAANLTYYGVQWSIQSLEPMALILERILDKNLTLPPAQRIRAVGTSQQITPDKPGYDRLMKAVQRANFLGVLFLWTETPSYHFMGLDRDPTGDPNDPNSYLPGMFVRGTFYRGDFAQSTIPWVPMDSRTVAAETGPEDYRYDREGGMSWSVPWVVGLYALAAQVKPTVTPQEFWQALKETGTYRTFTQEGKEYKLGPIANPPALIAKLKQG